MVQDKVKVDILGTEYSVERRKRLDDGMLEERDGYCDESIKLIVVEDFQREPGNLVDLTIFEQKVLRHEVIHAFLSESGLASNSDWARNEEMVDYFAIQIPKMIKVMNSLTLIP